MAYFDAHLIAPTAPLRAQSGALPHGAILFGAGAGEGRREMADARPEGNWLIAAAIDHLTGKINLEAEVISVQLADAALLESLRPPFAAWRPLADAVSARDQALHLSLPPGAAAIAGMRRLARQFPRTRFLLDPFRNGTAHGWQAQVRLAELENVWLTTLGLYPRLGDDVEEAIHFVSGEVGAGRLLFASGLRWEEQRDALPVEQWLAEITSLDDDQRKLVAEKNAVELFGR